MEKATSPRDPGLRPGGGLLGSRLLSLGCALTLMACGGSPTAPAPDLGGTRTVALPGGSTLVLAGATATDPAAETIEAIVGQTVEAARALLPLERITVRVEFGTAADVIPQLGFSGRAEPGTVRMTIDPDSSVWRSSLEVELGRVLAHELHHVARLRSVGFAGNLLERVVLEGLADRFVLELGGAPPPVWAIALVGAELDEWVERASEVWLDPDLETDPWFFHRPGSPIPHWTGYAVGFEITGRYLDQHPGARPSMLYAEPARSFIP